MKGLFMALMRKPPNPEHISGIDRGEEAVFNRGPEPGRGKHKQGYRTARDSTSVEWQRRQPIDPDMPNIPPP